MVNANIVYPSASLDICYYAIAYYRLSKYDRTSNQESDSIANQRKLVHAYLEKHPNIVLIDEADDDGYTGTNFDRPGFQKVLDAIKTGRVNCVIVKDLSRLGREYISTGNLLEKYFPNAGVRFIAINDDVDSENEKSGDDLLIPIKNLMNESYCRELSKKLRNQFRIQRGNGEFLGAFASYGYCKSPDDKHKLIVDENAAEVVKGIFSLKFRGYSQTAIAEFLSKSHIPTPMEYKKSQGLKYKTGFSTGSTPKWSAVTINRILTNPIYMGTLVQGKRGTPNYKVKSMKARKESEWSVIKDNHPAIIDPLMFAAVQRMLERDTRTSPQGEAVFPLSGVIFCADCGQSMLRRSVARGNRKFHYYVCSGNKKGWGCSSHSFECSKLEAVVLNAIQKQIQLIVEIDDLLQATGEVDVSKARVRQLDLSIARKENEMDELQDAKMRLYESLCDNLLDTDEYTAMKAKYNKRIAEAESALRELHAAKAEAVNNASNATSWIEQFLKFDGESTLSREMVFTLIDKVHVYEDKRIRIDFNFRNDIAFVLDTLQTQNLEVS